MRSFRECALVAGALGVLLAARPADGGGSAVPDAGNPGGVGDVGVADPCQIKVDRLARRLAWLEARRNEQFERGGAPDPTRGVPNMVGVYCEAHPGDEDCALGPIAIFAEVEELVAQPDAGPDDYEPHVLLMKRDLRSCRDGGQ